ncbi:MAG TPA: hypothetical protein VFA04_15445 [Bryobacteraceae bacterium]|nr:hypothetical protein [Bryobacteraceae bacterium]
MPVPWKRVIVLVLFGAVSLNQTSLDVTLTVEVRPESRLDVSQTTLRFVVPARGPREVRSAPLTLAAAARPGYGQQVRLIAHTVSDLEGAAGRASLSTVHWRGAKTSSRAGGDDAQCTTGQLRSHSGQDLVRNWTRGGTLSCTVTFILAAPPNLRPGTYSAPITFDLRLE